MGNGTGNPYKEKKILYKLTSTNANTNKLFPLVSPYCITTLVFFDPIVLEQEECELNSLTHITRNKTPVHCSTVIINNIYIFAFARVFETGIRQFIFHIMASTCMYRYISLLPKKINWRNKRLISVTLGFLMKSKIPDGNSDNIISYIFQISG